MDTTTPITRPLALQAVSMASRTSVTAVAATLAVRVGHGNHLVQVVMAWIVLAPCAMLGTPFLQETTTANAKKDTSKVTMTGHAL